ncbi:GNAT family N-acetyltransferase [Clostridium botulinum]|nr:GNAT family N-acetyltransferase [Clostridium botulinum]
MDFIVREAKLSDLDNILELWRELSVDQLGKDNYYKGSLEFNCGDGQIKESIINDNCGMFVVEYNEEIHGFVEVWINRKDFSFEHNDYAYILHYYINEKGRNVRNIFTIMYHLYKIAHEWAISNGKPYIISDAFEHNERIVKFLKRVGVSKYKTRMVRKI